MFLATALHLIISKVDIICTPNFVDQYFQSIKDDSRYFKMTRFKSKICQRSSLLIN